MIVFNPGEVPVTGGAGGADFTGYLGIQTLTGQYAYATGGAGIVIEHRFWGTSSPYTNLTAETLKYLTVDQAVKDMTYFAENVVLPFDRSGKSNAPKAPWVLVGGSYSGALAAWTEISAPGTYWAYHASSAPVQAIEDYVSFTNTRKHSELTEISGNISSRFKKEFLKIAATIFRLSLSMSTMS